jgi:hypothetical protein
MAFGANVWHTNNYKMVVDLKPQQKGNSNNEALGYDFYKINDNNPGCHIEVKLYDKLSPSGLDSVIRGIRENMKYVEVPVFLNGKQISIDPATEEWDEITEDAYIRRKGGGTLDIYNLGVLVTKQSQYMAGASGVVVSKKALDVNFARNAVQASCPVWKRVLKVLKEDNLKALKRKVPLDDVQRDFFSRQIFSGEIRLNDLDENRIITDVTNSHHPFSVFCRLSNYNNNISVAERGDRVAEMAHTRKLAFVVTKEMAERFNASTPEEFVAAVHKIFADNNRHIPRINAVDRSHFDKVISSSHEPVAEKELNKAERLALRALREANRTMYQQGLWYDYRSGTQTFNKSENPRRQGPRQISVGASDTALAWTDGSSNIWFERKQLKLIKNGMPGMIQLANILMHEYLHNEASTNTHEHGVEFYNRHHNLNVYTTIVADSANAMMRSTLKSIRADDKTLTQQLAKFEDSMTEASEFGVGRSPEDIEIHETDETIIYPDYGQADPIAALAPAIKHKKKKANPEPEENSPQISMKF